LFYSPVHFLITRAIVRNLGFDEIARVVDLGCGTGAAGAAWAVESGSTPIAGFDLNPWAVAEASWTYRTFGLRGHAHRSDVGRLKLRAERGTGYITAYTVNELKPESRASLLRQLLSAGGRGGRILVVEPIARRTAPWWEDWQAAFERAGGTSGEWRFPGTLPARQSQLARAAGLDPKELTARSLHL
jgi:trans-aconitate methyltransferase